MFFHQLLYKLNCKLCCLPVPLIYWFLCFTYVSSIVVWAIYYCTVTALHLCFWSTFIFIYLYFVFILWTLFQILFLFLFFIVFNVTLIFFFFMQSTLNILCVWNMLYKYSCLAFYQKFLILSFEFIVLNRIQQNNKDAIFSPGHIKVALPCIR